MITNDARFNRRLVLLVLLFSGPRIPVRWVRCFFAGQKRPINRSLLALIAVLFLVPRLGFGAEIAARVVEAGFDDLDAPITRLNGVFAPTPYSPPLEAAMVPSAAGIAQAIRKLVEE